VAVIYAGTRGYLDGVAVNRIAAYQEHLIAKLKASYPKFLEGIRTQKALTPELETMLKGALEDFGKTFH
jgi:F-type H+-transporting ATPase subunit alpha